MPLIPVVWFNGLLNRPAGLLWLKLFIAQTVYGYCRIVSVWNYQFNG